MAVKKFLDNVGLSHLVTKIKGMPDDATIEYDETAGLRVKDGGITGNQIAKNTITEDNLSFSVNNGSLTNDDAIKYVALINMSENLLVSKNDADDLFSTVGSYAYQIPFENLRQHHATNTIHFDEKKERFVIPYQLSNTSSTSSPGNTKIDFLTVSTDGVIAHHVTNDFSFLRLDSSTYEKGTNIEVDNDGNMKILIKRSYSTTWYYAQVVFTSDDVCSVSFNKTSTSISTLHQVFSPFRLTSSNTWLNVGRFQESPYKGSSYKITSDGTLKVSTISSSYSGDLRYFCAIDFYEDNYYEAAYFNSGSGVFIVSDKNDSFEERPGMDELISNSSIYEGDNRWIDHGSYKVTYSKNDTFGSYSGNQYVWDRTEKTGYVHGTFNSFVDFGNTSSTTTPSTGHSISSLGPWTKINGDTVVYYEHSIVNWTKRYVIPVTLGQGWDYTFDRELEFPTFIYQHNDAVYGIYVTNNFAFYKLPM